jgi:glucose/mannose-6-phosphate isomerase
MLLLGVFHRLGLAQTAQGEVDAALVAVRRLLSQIVEEVPARDNPAKKLAGELQGKLAVVTGGGIFSGLARRWKTQFNENAKSWAFFEAIPEVLHNAVEAYGTPSEVAGHVVVLVLQPMMEEPLARRYRVLTRLLEERCVPHRVLQEGEGPPLAQVLSMLLLGDYTSYYLALLNGVDPSPTHTIDLAKQWLSDSAG